MVKSKFKPAMSSGAGDGGAEAAAAEDHSNVAEAPTGASDAGSDGKDAGEAPTSPRKNEPPPADDAANADASPGSRKKPQPAAVATSGKAQRGKRKRKSKSNSAKKPKDMPRRPMSAYNVFFQEQRAKLLEEQEKAGGSSEGGKSKKIGFESMAKTIAKRWRELKPGDLGPYQDKAHEDMGRYRKEMEDYQLTLARRYRLEREKEAKKELEEEERSGHAGNGKEEDSKVAATSGRSPELSLSIAAAHQAQGDLLGSSLPGQAAPFAAAGLSSSQDQQQQQQQQQELFISQLLAQHQQQQQQQQQQLLLAQLGQQQQVPTSGFVVGQQQQPPPTQHHLYAGLALHPHVAGNAQQQQPQLNSGFQLGAPSSDQQAAQLLGYQTPSYAQYDGLHLPHGAIQQQQQQQQQVPSYLLPYLQQNTTGPTPSASNDQAALIQQLLLQNREHPYAADGRGPPGAPEGQSEGGDE